MAIVRAFMSMSLDGFVTGPDVSVAHPMGIGGHRLHSWFGKTMDAADAEVAAAMFSAESTGAVVMGRRTFDVGIGPWGDDGTFHLPCFVLTHRSAPRLVKGPTSFDFVTDGVAAVLARAQAVAGERAVNVMGAATVQQFLQAELLDEIHIDLVPVLLAAGTRLFSLVNGKRVELELTRLVGSPVVTHVSYRVLRPVRR